MKFWRYILYQFFFFCGENLWGHKPGCRVLYIYLCFRYHCKFALGILYLSVIVCILQPLDTSLVVSILSLKEVRVACLSFCTNGISLHFKWLQILITSDNNNSALLALHSFSFLWSFLVRNFSVTYSNLYIGKYIIERK